MLRTAEGLAKLAVEVSRRAADRDRATRVRLIRGRPVEGYAQGPPPAPYP